MSTTTRNTSDNSVTFSLAELAKLEERRVREEDEQRARSRENEARERREAQAQKRAAEAAQVAAEAEARAKRVREEAVEKVRLEARERAAVDVARIEAESRARLEADNATRAHELAVLRVHTDSGRRRLQYALAGVIGLVVCGGSGAAYGVTRHVAGITQDAERLREGQLSLAQERENARATELKALDRRKDALLARPLAKDAGEARATVEAARGAVDARAVDHGRMRAFADALDVLQARIDTLERIAALDRRGADLAAWAAERKQSSATAAAKSAATRAKLTGTEDALRAYEVALDQLRDTLAQSTSGAGRPGVIVEPKRPAGSCAAGDPGCGLDGRPLF
jgi:hypothetical protein